MIGYLKKVRIFEFFRIKNVLDLNFETQVYLFIELLNPTQKRDGLEIDTSNDCDWSI